VLGFEPPAEVDQLSPAIERLVTDASREIAAAPRAILEVDAPPGDAVLDGARRCVTPCRFEVARGAHTLRYESPGFSPDARTVHVDEDRTLVVTPEPAPPELAREQWASRYAAGRDLDSQPSVSLLARAIRARNLVLVQGAEERGGVRVRGVLAVDGAVAGRAERSGSVSEATETLLRELLVQAEILAPAPPLFRRAGFWLAVGAAALVAAGVTALVLHERPVRTDVRVPPRSE